MSIITLAEAKLHLRVDHSDEDALIQVILNASESAASSYMGRSVFVDSGALATAIAAIPAALTAATAAYDAAMTAADAMTNEVEQLAAYDAASYNYQSALQSAREIRRGIVMNDQIKAAVLIHVGSLYANRESDIFDGQAMPNGVRWLLDPYRVYA